MIRTYVLLLIAALSVSAINPGCKKHHKDKPTTLNLSPSPNPLELHLFGYLDFDGSDPNAPEIGAAAWTSGGSPIYMRAALNFDLSTIPVTATIQSAKLSLYSNPTPLNGNGSDANFGTDNSLLIQQITSPWSANTAKWTNQPITTATNQIVIPHTSQNQLDLLNLDVTQMVRDMVASASYGFFLVLQNEVIYTSRIFCSSKYSDGSKHPRLSVVYTSQ